MVIYTYMFIWSDIYVLNIHDDAALVYDIIFLIF